MAIGIAVKPDIPRPSRPPTDASPASGFAARLDGASLADLVQIECMRGVRRVIRVTSEGRFGYLYFDQGHVVHATSAGRVGESAALWILSWKAGTFEACEQVWPVRHTIQTPVQSLVLRAAQHEDEARRSVTVESASTSEGSGISPVPAVVRAVPPANEVTSSEAAETPPLGASRLLDSPASERKGFEDPTVTSNREVSKHKAGVLRAVRLDGDGNVLSHVGPALGDFADVASYTLRLCTLIGESLGLDDFMGIESTSADKTFLAFWDKETVVALEAQPNADIDTYKKRGGL